MLVKNQKILTTWNPTTRKYYEERGYVFTKYRESLEVDIKDLPHSSHAYVKVICDFCGEEIIKRYKDYWFQHENGDCCKNCEGKKSLKVGELKYGKGYRKKLLEKISMQRYGVKNVAGVKEIQEKIKQTNLKRYGIPYLMNSEEGKKKAIEKSWSSKAREKRKQTNVKKYGFEQILSVPSVRVKIAKSFYLHGSVKTSKPQVQLYEALKEIYGQCELNYPCGPYSLDCYLELDDKKIDIEYDGAYFHQNTKEHDNKRNNYVLEQGLYILRIIGAYKIPDKEKIQELIKELLNKDERILIYTL